MDDPRDRGRRPDELRRPVPGAPGLAPELQSHFHLSLEGVGVVLASVNLGVLATVLPWGILADRVGERAVIAVGLGSASVAVAAAALANGVVGLSIALFAAGGLGACVQAASGRAVMGWFAPSQRGLALGIRQTGVPLGGAIAALVLPVCLSVSGLRAALAVLAGALLVAAAAGAIWLRDPARPPDPGGAERPPLADPRIWRLCWASGLLYVALGSLIGFAVLFLHSDRGVSTQVAAAMLALVQVIGAALRLVAGRWSDQVGDAPRPASQARPCARGLVGGRRRARLRAAGRPRPALVVAGSLSQSWNGLSFTAAAEIAGYARSGAALGLQQASLSLSSVVTPVGFAAIVAATSWGVGFGVAAAAALAGTVALRGLGEG